MICLALALFCRFVTPAHAVTGPDLVTRARADGRAAIEASVDFQILLAAARDEAPADRAAAQAALIHNIEKALRNRGGRDAHLRRRLKTEWAELLRTRAIIAARGGEAFTLEQRTAAVRALTHYVTHARGRSRAAVEAIAFAAAAGPRAHDPRAARDFLDACVSGTRAVREDLRFYLIDPALRALHTLASDVGASDGVRAVEREFRRHRPVGAWCARALTNAPAPRS